MLAFLFVRLFALLNISEKFLENLSVSF